MGAFWICQVPLPQRTEKLPFVKWEIETTFVGVIALVVKVRV